MRPLQTLKTWLLRWLYRLVNYLGWRGHLPDRPSHDLLAQLPVGSVRLRVYPGDAAAQACPLIIYMHGGGFVIGDLQTHHGCCLNLVERTGHSVVAIDYRRAPEHPFPAAHDDCLAVTEWITARPGELAPGNGRVILAGDSAGGNLVAATAAALSAEARAHVVGQVIFYPTVDYDAPGYPSYLEKARAYPLTSGLMHWFWQTYLHGSALGRGSDDYRQRATVLHADGIDRLPPTFLVTAENDPLRDEGIAYAHKLRAAGVALTHHHFSEATHGFASSEGPTRNYLEMMTRLQSWLEQRRAGVSQSSG
jgi:acetyl esterase